MDTMSRNTLKMILSIGVTNSWQDEPPAGEGWEHRRILEFITTKFSYIYKFCTKVYAQIKQKMYQDFICKKMILRSYRTHPVRSNEVVAIFRHGVVAKLTAVE